MRQTWKKILIVEKRYHYSRFSLTEKSGVDELINIEETLKQSKSGIALIIIDPLSSVINGDHTNEANVRENIEKLTKLAEVLKCAIIGIAHTSKSVRGKDPLARIASARAITQVARSVLLVVKNSSKSTINGNFVLIKAKSNLASTDGGLSYNIIPHDAQFSNGAIVPTSKVEWFDHLGGSNTDIIAKAEVQVHRGGSLITAQAFLMRELRKGRRTTREINELASIEGISLATLSRARKLLGVQSEKGTGNITWLFLTKNN